MLANVVSGLVWRGGGAVSSSGLRRGMWLLGYIGAGYTVRAGIWLSVNSHCPDCPDATLHAPSSPARPLSGGQQEFPPDLALEAK